MSASISCATCGRTFRPKKSSKGGRPQKHCGRCQKPRGEVRDVAGAKERKNARRRAKRSAAVVPIADEMHQARELAAALSLFADARSAARYVGIAAEGGELDRLVALARDHHAGVVEGERAELGRQLIAAMFLCAGAAVRHRDQIAPRDLPHVMRAFAQVHALIVGDQIPPFAELRMFIVGADGKPFDPNEIPQVEQRVEPLRG